MVRSASRRIPWKLYVVLAVVVFTGVNGVSASPIIVDPNGSFDFTKIQAAIDDAVNGNEIEVMPGTYKEAINFRGKAIALRSKHGPEVTTIDAGGYRKAVICNSGEDHESTLEGFTITGGWGDYGGGMYCENSSPSIIDCNFSSNSAYYFGGGLYCRNSSPVVTDCNFTGNFVTTGSGGGMCCQTGNPTVANCTFTQNEAETYGGGMFNDGSYGACRPTVRDCRFYRNHADYKGGGICNSDSDISNVINCTFSLNTSDYGGGMYSYISSPKITNCLFEDNSATASGGAMANERGFPQLTNCTFNGNSADDNGGGMSNYKCNPAMSECTFSDNSAVYYGGGISNDWSSPTVTHCSFEDNKVTTGSGGGMYNYDFSCPTVSDCNFTGNKAETSGGGIHNDYSYPPVTDCNFTRNSAVYKGGGMCNSHSSPTVTYCRFEDNEVTHASVGSGGGMFNYESSVNVTDCLFHNNTSASYGGGIGNEGMFPEFTNCTLTGNKANYGAGIYNMESNAKVSNSLFHDNEAESYGGGAGNEGRYPEFTNCTFVKNEADLQGGGIWIYDGKPNVTNCIVWRNTAKTGLQIYGGSPTVTYSNVQGGYGGTENFNISEDPLFIDITARDLRLLAPSSPCVDAGKNSAVSPMATDLAGNARKADGDGNGTFRVDMGAYELPFGIHNVTQGTRYGYISVALDRANNGDEIEVAPGVYNEAVDFKDKAIRLYSSGGPEVTTINGAGAYHVVQCVKEQDANTILEGFTITGGNANGTFTDTRGGGIYCENSSPTVTNCIVRGNTALSDGGGMFNDNSSPTVRNCTFFNNTALQNGGGIYNYRNSNPTISNCTFTSHNSYSVTYGGGAMFNYGSSPELTNCTFIGNAAIADGGGMYNYSGSTPTVTNCILWGDDPDEIFNEGTSSSTVSFSNVEGGWSGEGNINANPLLGSLGRASLSLVPWSPCIDVGSNDVVSPDATDIAGMPRVVDGNCAGGAIVDMGARELQHIYMGDFDSSCLINMGDYAVMALAWLSSPVSENWDPVCDIGIPGNEHIDAGDLWVLARNWLHHADTSITCDANELRNVFGLDAVYSATVLSSSTCAYSPNDVAQLLHNSGYSAGEVYAALTQVCGMSDGFALEQILHDVGYLPEDYLESTALSFVEKFAPVLLFDGAHKGLPMSAQVYFETVMSPKPDSPSTGQIEWSTPWDGSYGKPGVTCLWGRDECTWGMENNDFETLLNGEVPTYYKVISDIDSDVDTGAKGRLRIAYWWFYGFQKYCNSWPLGEDGSHHGDWEFVWVTTDPNRLQADAVTYVFHGVWYTRQRPHFYCQEDRPIVYVGKLGHGNYHNDDHSGWMAGTPSHCCHYADYKDVADDSEWHNTYQNLVSLRGDSEPWMLADQIGSPYEYYGREYTISPWRWGPHISYCHTPSDICADWHHTSACGTHPTVDYPMDWYIDSCKDEGCRDRDCGGLVYTPPLPDYDQGWPWEGKSMSSPSKSGVSSTGSTLASCGSCGTPGISVLGRLGDYWLASP